MLCADLVDIQWRDQNGRLRRGVANLEDISLSGACLQVERPVALGSPLQISYPKGELTGKVNSVQFSHDGSRLIVASGIPGLYGVATVLNATDGATVLEVKGHRDALYDAKLSPNGELLATCSHDRQIRLWNADSGDLVRTLAGHNGAVVRLAFSADSSLLASASADGTVKIWKVATGERLDTLGAAEIGRFDKTLGQIGVHHLFDLRFDEIG